MLERTPTAAPIVQLKSIPTGNPENGAIKSWQNRLASKLVRHAQPDSADAGSESLEPTELPAAHATVSLIVYRVPDQTPYEFFARCADIDRPCADAPGFKSKFGNTLIALVKS